MSYIGMAAQFPNAIMNCINLFCQCGYVTFSGKIDLSVNLSVVECHLIYALHLLSSLQRTCPMGKPVHLARAVGLVTVTGYLEQPERLTSLSKQNQTTFS